MSIEDGLLWILPCKFKDKPEFGTLAVTTAMLQVTNELLLWVGQRCDLRDDYRMQRAITVIGERFTQPMFDAGAPVSVRHSAQLSVLRSQMGRMSVISRTSYLPEGFTLVEVFSLMAHFIVICAYYKDNSSALAYTCIICTSILYAGMNLLLRSVDDPFQYKSLEHHTTDDAARLAQK